VYEGKNIYIYTCYTYICIYILPGRGESVYEGKSPKRARDTFISSTLGICPCAPSSPNMSKEKKERKYLDLKRDLRKRPINMERAL